METTVNREVNYYNRELSKIVTTGEYIPKIQVRDEEGNCSKWLSLNNECIEELIAFLNMLKVVNEGRK